MTSRPCLPVPFPAYPAALRYPDVDPDVLAREDADDRGDDAFSWQSFLRGTLAKAGGQQPGAGDS